MECTKYKDCNVPICPEVSGDLWYPDEAICHRTTELTRRQKKIAKRTKDISKYFTFDMLNHNFIIHNEISGIDPDKDEQQQI